jgi:hypothetical protein
MDTSDILSDPLFALSVIAQEKKNERARIGAKGCGRRSTIRAHIGAKGFQIRPIWKDIDKNRSMA